MTIPGLLDDEPAAPTGSTASMPPRIDVCAQTTVPRPAPQETGPLLLLVLLGVFGLVLGLGWVAWSIIASAPPPPVVPPSAGAAIGAGARAAAPAAPGTADVPSRVEAEPLPDVPDAGVVGSVAAAFRTLPKRPSDLAIDLLGREALSTIQPYQMAWSGSSLFAFDERGCSIDWFLAPANAGSVALDGWVALRAPPGTTENTVLLQVTLPVSPALHRGVKLPWPSDGNYHRLRCWASPGGPVVVAIGDTVLAEDAIKRHRDSANPKIGFLASTDMRIGSLRIFGTGDFVRMQSRVEANKEVLSPGDRLVPMELHDAPRPAQGIFRPYEPGGIIDPFALAALQADPMAQQLAAQQAAFVARRLRPYDQGECDLAARLLWLAQCLDPGCAQLVAVRAALSTPGGAIPELPALSESAEQEMHKRQITCIAPYSYAFGTNREMRLLCQDAAWFMVPSHISGTFHAYPEERCDWPLLASLGRGLDENGRTWRREYYRLVRSTEGRWSYPKASDGDQFQATHGGDDLQPHILVPGSKPVREPSMNASIRVLTRGDGEPYLVPDHTLWADGELAVECHGTGTLELVPIADPGQVLARIQIRLVPPSGQTPALVLAGLGKPGMSARLYAKKQKTPPPERPEDPKFEVDLARVFTPWRIWIERKGGDLSWQVWGGQPQSGRVVTPGPTALLFRPAHGAGLSITRFLSRAVVAKDTGPQDSLKRMPLGEYLNSVPRPPSTSVSVFSPFVLTEGVRNTVTLYTALELRPGQQLWALDVQTRRPWPTRRWLAVDESGNQLVEINAAVPPKNRSVHPGFALQVVGPAGAPAGDVRGKAYEVRCQPAHAGEFLLTDKVEPNGWSDVTGNHLKWNLRLVVVPAKRGWDPAIWCRGLQDAAVRGRPEPYDLVAVLRAMSTDWDPDSLWQPPRSVRPAAEGSPKAVMPVIVDQPEQPDAP